MLLPLDIRMVVSLELEQSSLSVLTTRTIGAARTSGIIWQTNKWYVCGQARSDTKILYKRRRKRRRNIKPGSTTLTRGTDKISRGKLEDIARQIIDLNDQNDTDRHFWSHCRR
ncbi:MAG: hypothetical protein IPK94_22855 [Saprospiraceae bacterium]|nr:hypothetical protein [Saprospiraceae bacterium]